MAFVFGKAKKTANDPLEHSPGPGEYLHSQKSQPQHAAPFNCSTFKTSLFDVTASKTGPGSYNPPCPKQLQSDKSMRMTSCFSSKVERFKTQPRQQPPKKQELQVKLVSDTPYRYNPNKTDKTTQKEIYTQVIQRVKSKVSMLQEANHKRKSESIGGNREFVRIVLSNPKNTEVLHSVFIDSSIKKKENGPGSYNIEGFTHLNKGSHVVDWSRNTANRFRHQKDKNPGPGSYSVDEKKNQLITSQSSAFAFQGLRSHIDQVVYRTKMPFKVKVIQEKKLKDRYPGPGHYNPHKVSSKSFHYGQERFGSTQYQSRQEEQILPGPGSYQIIDKEKPENYKEQLKKNREKIFGKSKIKGEKVDTLIEQNKEEVRKQCILEIQRTANKFYSLQERCTSKIGNFAHADRWKQPPKTRIPGPGQYKVQAQPKEQRAIKMLSVGFNSAVEDRSTFLSHSYNTPFYEVDRNDLGKHALRVRKNIENLKQIDIDKAPFNIKERRFCSDSKFDKRQSEASRQAINRQPNYTRQANQEIVKKMANGPQPTAQFKSKTKRSWVAINNELGPGDYDQPTFMEKKSFNQEYNYNPPIKIRSTFRTRSSMA